MSAHPLRPGAGPGAAAARNRAARPFARPPVPPTLRAAARTAAALALALAAACAPAPAADGAWPEARGLGLETVATGLDRPVQVVTRPGDPRLHVVEQGGRVRVVERGRALGRPFLDLGDRVRAGGERGLLSIAFHPRHAENGLLFANYTDREGATRVERFRVPPGADTADPASGTLVLRVRQPYANHNGGHVLFAPDGMLWIAMGDGGSGGDPQGHGQNRRTLLGALLRIDVDRATPYAVPPDNPWADGAGGQPEIWATGVRNPWRIWIDPVENLLYVADVGQNRWEEVHVASAGAPGLNYGWNLMEGRHPYGAARADAGGLELPPVEYAHDDGCSVTGGVVYRGRALPQLAGHYLFSDYCTGWIRSFRWDGRAAVARRQWALPALRSVTSFGVDAGGEPLVVSHEGTIYRLVPAR